MKLPSAGGVFHAQGFWLFSNQASCAGWLDLMEKQQNDR
jgi:hypothetical protein